NVLRHALDGAAVRVLDVITVKRRSRTSARRRPEVPAGRADSQRGRVGTPSPSPLSLLHCSRKTPEPSGAATYGIARAPVCHAGRRPAHSRPPSPRPRGGDGNHTGTGGLPSICRRPLASFAERIARPRVTGVRGES